MGLGKLFKSRLVHGLFGAAISLAAIVWMYLALDWQLVGQSLAGMHYWALLPALLIYILHYVLRSMRWRLLLPGESQSSLSLRFDSIVVGTLASFILPLRIGEFVRPYMLSLKSEHSFSASFISVVIERIFDLSVVLLSFVLITFFLSGIPDWVHSGAIVLSCLAVVLVLIMLVGIAFPEQLKNFVQRLVSFFPRSLQELSAGVLDSFVKGSAVLQDRKRLLLVSLFSLLVWGSCYFNYYIFLHLFDIPPSALMAVSVTVFVALAVAAPSAPGFIGIYQVACIAGFMLFGVNAEQATAYAIATHLFQYVFMLCYGSFVLVHRGLKLGDLSAASGKDIA